MRNSQKLIPILLAIAVCGCINAAPPKNRDFGTISTLEDLVGTHRHLGEGKAGLRKVYLSSLIWPDAKLDHASIGSIMVRSPTPQVVLVEAIGSRGVEYSQTFVEGEDFEFREGRLLLLKHVGVAPVKSKFIGAYYEKQELGLDTEGQGKWRQKGAVVGLLGPFPLVLGGHEDVRFVKEQKP